MTNNISLWLHQPNSIPLSTVETKTFHESLSRNTHRLSSNVVMRMVNNVVLLSWTTLWRWILNITVAMVSGMVFTMVAWRRTNVWMPSRRMPWTWLQLNLLLLDMLVMKLLHQRMVRVVLHNLMSVAAAVVATAMVMRPVWLMMAFWWTRRMISRQPGRMSNSVSYTHLTLPTIYPV